MEFFSFYTLLNRGGRCLEIDKLREYLRKNKYNFVYGWLNGEQKLVQDEDSSGNQTEPEKFLDNFLQNPSAEPQTIVFQGTSNENDSLKDLNIQLKQEGDQKTITVNSTREQNGHINQIQEIFVCQNLQQAFSCHATKIIRIPPKSRTTFPHFRYQQRNLALNPQSQVTNIETKTGNISTALTKKMPIKEDHAYGYELFASLEKHPKDLIPDISTLHHIEDNIEYTTRNVYNKNGEIIESMMLSHIFDGEKDVYTKKKYADNQRLVSHVQYDVYKLQEIHNKKPVIKRYVEETVFREKLKHLSPEKRSNDTYAYLPNRQKIKIHSVLKGQYTFYAGKDTKSYLSVQETDDGLILSGLTYKGRNLSQSLHLPKDYLTILKEEPEACVTMRKIIEAQFNALTQNKQHNHPGLESHLKDLYISLFTEPQNVHYPKDVKMPELGIRNFPLIFQDPQSDNFISSVSITKHDNPTQRHAITYMFNPHSSNKDLEVFDSSDLISCDEWFKPQSVVYNNKPLNIRKSGQNLQTGSTCGFFSIASSLAALSDGSAEERLEKYCKKYQLERHCTPDAQTKQLLQQQANEEFQAQTIGIMQARFFNHAKDYLNYVGEEFYYQHQDLIQHFAQLEKDKLASQLTNAPAKTISRTTKNGFVEKHTLKSQEIPADF